MTMHMEDDVNDQIVRKTAAYVNVSKRFRFSGQRKFRRQYSHIYSQRLSTCRPKLLLNARKKWGDDIPCRKLFEIVADERCFIIGTLYKDMPNKPNILAEITVEEEPNQESIGVLEKCTTPEDFLILEDELQRIVLKGDVIDVKSHVTGVVLAVLGLEPEDKRGRFVVEDVVYLNSYPPPPRPMEPVDDTDRWIAVVSGLGLGGKEEDSLAIQMMVDCLVGLLGSPDMQMKMSKVVRLLVAGNSLSETTSDKQKLATQARYLSRKTFAGSVVAMKNLDSLLSQLSSQMPVCVMPGQHDPGYIMLPQQPLHKLMFSEAGQYATFHTVTNPFAMCLDGRFILCTSGQNIHDLYRFSEIETVLERMEKTLTWGHIAPTCPDTLCCYPFYDRDPFILTDDDFSTPRVYICGNQSEFDSKIIGEGEARTLLVSVPEFHRNATCVLINPFTLQCEAIEFSSVLMDTDTPAENNIFWKGNISSQDEPRN